MIAKFFVTWLWSLPKTIKLITIPAKSGRLQQALAKQNYMSEIISYPLGQIKLP